MFKDGQLKSLGIASGLVLLNVAVMWIFAFTPLNTINDLLFGSFFLLGVIVYGAMLTGGVWIAKKGIRSENTGMAVGGATLVQVAYGLFGAGALGLLPVDLQAVALLITGVVTTGIAVLSGLLVFGTDHDFSQWGRYANYIFLGVLGISLIGSFSPPVTILAFGLALLGFIVYLIHQIYMTKTRPGKPFLNGIGLYTAYMGVFVEILQLVVEMLLRRE
jgi:FtsH-binding integral membrane protein